MTNKIEAIKEAIGFIKETWMGNAQGTWEGTANEFVGATLGDSVTVTDIQAIVEAFKEGQWTPIEIDGDIEKGHLTTVRVWK
jgi:hypothetical protein